MSRFASFTEAMTTPSLDEVYRVAGDFARVADTPAQALGLFLDTVSAPLAQYTDSPEDYGALIADYVANIKGGSAITECEFRAFVSGWVTGYRTAQLSQAGDLLESRPALQLASDSMEDFGVRFPEDGRRAERQFPFAGSGLDQAATPPAEHPVLRLLRELEAQHANRPVPTDPPVEQVRCTDAAAKGAGTEEAAGVALALRTHGYDDVKIASCGAVVITRAEAALHGCPPDLTEAGHALVKIGDDGPCNGCTVAATA